MKARGWFLLSGTAVGLSLIVWSVHRAWQRRRRREAVEVRQEQCVKVPEKQQEEPREATGDAAGEEPAATATEPAAEARETEIAPAPQNIDEAEATLFPVKAEMYELKAAAEGLPAIQIPRRARRGPVALQLLLWPDADEPPAGRDQPPDIATI